jgi:hypothetical protein
VPAGASCKDSPSRLRAVQPCRCVQGGQRAGVTRQPGLGAQVEHRIFEAEELKPLLDAVNAETQKEKESEA